jgi:hypothetical protein
MGSQPKITICIPHWQVGRYMTICLRSIRKHSARYNLDVVVVDNGSRDASLEYLRSLSWIRVIERPEETHTNWPANVNTAWDLGARNTDAEYYLTMHSDVFVKRDDWLDPFLREFARNPRVGAAGAWKLSLENPLYMWQKRVVGFSIAKLKSLAGLRKAAVWKQGHYPRDYCAMYRTKVLVERDLTFCSTGGVTGGGLSIATQLMNAGYEMGMIPVEEMARNIVHVAHGTAAIVPEKPLNHRRAQKQVERRVARLLQESWIKSLESDHTLDGPVSRQHAA